MGRYPQGLTCRRWRGGEHEHAGDRLAQQPHVEQSSSLAGLQSDAGGLRTGQGTVLRGPELSSGANGVVAAHSDEGSIVPTARTAIRSAIYRISGQTGVSRCGTSPRSGPWSSPSSPIRWQIAMYAVISAGANQQKVAEGEQVAVDLLDAAEGDEVSLTATLLVDGDRVLATPDELAGVTVTGRVVGEAKGPKIDAFTYNRRPNQRRRYGHRQRYTVVEITKIAT